MRRNLVPLIAIFGGITLILVAISMQGELGSFLSISAFVIVIVGSFAALMVSYPLKDLMAVPIIIKQIFEAPMDNRKEMINLFAKLSKKSRREGILSLEDDIREVNDDFLERGIQMVIDGIEPETIEDILQLEMEATEKRHSSGQKIFKSWGDYAPAFGMIGTLIGLIVMLSDLNDSSAIGIGMATALITTFYGALFANLILLPIANNLKVQTEEELFTREMMIEGILAIQAGNNPRIVEERLTTYLSPSERKENRNVNENMETVSENG
ncbi:MAG: motility protein A [Firmicutes bacterium]|nr:motility protein A [Bacillota bacterium]